eukprot:TRINITY_DN1051_c0_g1_i3.p1 TRINITY_DN1051_c0_g1~~TRINITY_DN1051_c0_g1_i3.p1  ORF type:complete len:136 (+),score=27.44 TRINITY_DN1051_c0_g1_i3:152-559(+)
MEIRKAQRWTELLFLAVAWLSILACLIRTDYNFAFALFCYYLWITKETRTVSTLLMIVVGILCVADVIWLFTVGSIWTTNLKQNKVWNRLHGLHIFVFGISIINLLLKVGMLLTINYVRKSQSIEEASPLRANPA